MLQLVIGPNIRTCLRFSYPFLGFCASRAYSIDVLGTTFLLHSRSWCVVKWYEANKNTKKAKKVVEVVDVVDVVDVV